LIPFLFFSFVGTTVLVYVGLASQQSLIKKEEKKEILNFYHLCLELIGQKEAQALSLATAVASEPTVQRLLADRDDVGLVELLYPLYHKLKKDFEILHFHFHIPPGRSFLRLHMVEEKGEALSYRKGVTDVMRTGKGVSGLEWGIAGLGIRGVSPIYYRGTLAGSLDIGFPFGKRFVDILKQDWGPDFTVYEKKSDREYTLLATTLSGNRGFDPCAYLGASDAPMPAIFISPKDQPDKSILLGPIKDTYGDTAALVEIRVDRSRIMKRLASIRNLMMLIGVTGLVLSFTLTWTVAALFIRPIKEIVKEAQEIAEEKREVRLDPRPMDEIGDLAYSLNMMLDTLKQKQSQIESHARTLELRVHERTRDLVASEEKYRTLVESLPLIVYRVLRDGTTEFINPCFTETLGYSADEVVGDKRFWASVICGCNVDGPIDLLDCCWQGTKEYRMERTLTNAAGQHLTFIDQAIPQVSEQGGVKWIDGIMVDITELKKLQDRAMRTEEIRILGEISARFAHELRNPLASAGGFARRLRDTLAEGHPSRKPAQIIVEEVARLEEILRIVLSSIEPVVLQIGTVEMAELLRACIAGLAERAAARRVRIIESLPPTLPPLEGDASQLHRAFHAILENALLCIPEGENLTLSGGVDHEVLRLTIQHPAAGLADDDLDQFFLPRFAGKAGPSVLDLPLAKIIIHRHGGKIDVSWEGERKLALRVELPLKSEYPPAT
jgi:PAS domain S-box-containing protein